MNEIRPGIRFLCNGELMETVKPNPTFPGDWFCKVVNAETRVWSFNPTSIIRRARDYDLGR